MDVPEAGCFLGLSGKVWSRIEMRKLQNPTRQKLSTASAVADVMKILGKSGVLNLWLPDLVIGSPNRTRDVS